MIIRLVSNALFWLNAFPHKDGVSSTLSPRYLLTGKHLDFTKHVCTEFGAYVQTHEEHTNNMNARTLGAICLGPSGNEQGGHFFMSLATGKRIHQNRLTDLSMPDDSIARVNHLAQRQGMPRSLTFADRYGFEIFDDDDDVEDDADSTYNPEDDQSIDSESDDNSDYDDDNEDEQDDNDDDHDVAQQTPRLPPPCNAPNRTAGVNIHDDHSIMEPEDEADDDQMPEFVQRPAVNDDDDDEDDDDEDIDNDPPSDYEYANDATINNAGVGGGGGSITVDEDEVEDDDTTMDGKYGRQTHGISLRDRKPRDYRHQYEPGSFEHTMHHFEDPLGELFQTEQMSLNRGLKEFGKAGADAVVSELEQLEYRKVLIPTVASDLSYIKKKASLNYLMFLKQMRCDRIKARGCADGRKQRLHKTKAETSSPTVSTEALFLTALIDANEGREVYTVNIPGAFMHSDMDELVHMKLDGSMAELLVRVNPDKYRKYVAKDKNGKSVVYAELAKALYGTVQAAILFWQNLFPFLIDKLGFVMNKYDRCVVNKTIDGKQCTILWHVDDLKMSHVSCKVLYGIINELSKKYGKEAPLTINRGKVHEYLGMTMDYSIPGKVQFIMNDYIENLLDDAPKVT
jgi:hypothetical protein